MLLFLSFGPEYHEELGPLLHVCEGLAISSSDVDSELVGSDEWFSDLKYELKDAILLLIVCVLLKL